MATPRARITAPSYLGGLALTLSLFLGSGCTSPPPPASTQSPAGNSTPVVLTSPDASPSPISFEEVVERYEAPADPTQNGWPELMPFVAGGQEGEPSEMEIASALDLSEAKDAETFDSRVLPTLKSAFRKAIFTGGPKLLSGQDPINPYYRDLRALCNLLTQRAEQLQAADKKEQAFEMVALPLALAHSLQSRPETVSVNDFSSKYAASSLATIADWASTNRLSGEEITQLQSILAQYRPSYDHLALSITVDFAQLNNSLANQDVRTQTLGLGLSNPQEIQGWKEQLRALHSQAQKLYRLSPIDAVSFNEAITKLAPPIQGIVIDYPNIAAMQKRSYASYLATELALTLERHRLSKAKEALTPEQVFQQTFGSDETSAKVAQAMLEVRVGPQPGQFTVAGRTGIFALTSPDPNVVFYQR